MNLNADNYFSQEAEKEYLSVSQYKRFMGSLGRVGCEAAAVAQLNGEWKEKTTDAMLVGSYVDAYFDGTLDKFKNSHPEILTQKGTLSAKFRKAEEVIERIERDKYFMAHMGGQKQVIMTFELFGVMWKIKIDSYFPGQLIVDLKIMKSLRDLHYVADYGHLDFIRYWGYDFQGAIYQKGVEILTGKKLPFKIAAASKEEYPDIEIIQVEQSLMDAALIEVERNIPTILALKNGEITPVRCGVCDYCKHTKVLEKSIWSSELLGAVQ